MMKEFCKFWMSAVLMIMGCCHLLGCDQLVCGPGTREVDGKCVVLAFPDDGGVQCGPNTVLVGNQCVPAEEVCGPYTTAVPVLDENGVPTGAFVCEGRATGDNPPPPCPDDFGPNGEICINGYATWLFDDSTGGFLETIMADSSLSEDATYAVVKVYDPIAYANDPVNTIPRAIGEVNPRFGTFRLTNVDAQGSGYLALVIDDIDEDAQNIFVQAGLAWRAENWSNLEMVQAAVINRDQVDDWTEKLGGDAALAAMGCPEPPGGGARTLATCGTWVGVYRDGNQDNVGIPVEGVIPYGPVGPLNPLRTFFPGLGLGGDLVFDDPEPGIVWSMEGGPFDYTGTLGAVFYPGANVQNMRGQCAPDTECAERQCLWRTFQGGSLSDVMFVQYMFPNTCNPVE